MIFFWNRKEVYFGTSMEKFSEVRSLLSINKIKYSYKVINNSSSFGSNRGHTGTFGQRIEYSYQYYVYVHKNDYEDALLLMKILIT